MMFVIVWCAIVIPSVALIGWWQFRAEGRKLERYLHYHRRWWLARGARKRWVYENCRLLNPIDDPAYETLFLTEVGAEQLFCFHCGVTQSRSYDEYLEEDGRYSMF